jgi:hypothetical protein
MKVCRYSLARSVREIANIAVSAIILGLLSQSALAQQTLGAINVQCH